MSSPDSASRPDDQRSVSDGDLDSEKKKRRARRRRGNRNRFRPYDVLGATSEPSEEVAGTSKETLRKAPRATARKEQPMAPCNTTQFLMEDMQARAEAEVELAHCEERRRVRSISLSSELFQQSDEGSETSSSDGEAEHREFETELEELNIGRLQQLSKDQMTREILDKDKEVEIYHETMIRVNRENERLRKILEENGIPYEDEHNHKTPSEEHPKVQPVA